MTAVSDSLSHRLSLLPDDAHVELVEPSLLKLKITSITSVHMRIFRDTENCDPLGNVFMLRLCQALYQTLPSSWFIEKRRGRVPKEWLETFHKALGDIPENMVKKLKWFSKGLTEPTFMTTELKLYLFNSAFVGLDSLLTRHPIPTKILQEKSCPISSAIKKNFEEHPFLADPCIDKKELEKFTAGLAIYLAPVLSLLNNTLVSAEFIEKWIRAIRHHLLPAKSLAGDSFASLEDLTVIQAVIDWNDIGHSSPVEQLKQNLAELEKDFFTTEWVAMWFDVWEYGFYP